MPASHDRPPARLVVVISGRGRNLEAIIDAIEAGRLHARITLVASNRRHARGLKTARLAGLTYVAIDPKAFADREAFDAALATRIAAEAPDWVVLAGYMRILGSAFVQRFAGRLVNIHPSLLPRHRGLRTHEQAIANGDARHGASVHFVTDDLDAGPLIRQGSIAVRDDDTPQTLSDRVVRQVEQRLYPEALADLIDKRVRWRGGRILRSGRSQGQCPHVDYDASSKN